MDKLIVALGPVFAAGLGIQQLAEILDPILDRFGADNKRLVVAVVSLALGLALSFGAGLHTLQPLGVASAGVLDPLLTGLIISGGTEGINSILKFLKYNKEDKKNEAAGKTPDNAGNASAAPSTDALKVMNRK